MISTICLALVWVFLALMLLTRGRARRVFLILEIIASIPLFIHTALLAFGGHK
jgi:hypothetical protein